MWMRWGLGRGIGKGPGWGEGRGLEGRKGIGGEWGKRGGGGLENDGVGFRCLIRGTWEVKGHAQVLLRSALASFYRHTYYSLLAGLDGSEGWI